MTNITNQLSTKWIKASVLGTVWAASEIILGSFLHNLKIPFSGNVLTAIALTILIAVSYRWKEQGIIWRSGVICALLKTMSPSAVIFGPMVAIFTEAVLLDFSTRLLGRNAVGFLVGAALASSWILVQKIMNYIIFYGMNIVEIYQSMMKYAEKQLNWQFNAVWTPILVLLILYILFGMFAAVIGMQAGRKIRDKTLDYSTFNSEKKTDFFKKDLSNFDYSLVWLTLNMLNMIAILVLNPHIGFGYWATFVVFTITVWAVRYKRATRQLMRAKFWLFFVAITMLTTFVFSSLQDKSWQHGVVIGIEMNLRAISLIMGFTVLGTELYNPKIRDYFARSNFKQLSLSLELSLQSLPMMLKNMPTLKTMIRRPEGMVEHLVAQAEWRLMQIEQQKTNGRVFIISGKIADGKTTFAEKYTQQLIERGQTVKGFTAPRMMANNETVGYFIKDVSNNKLIEFLNTKGNDKQQPKIGKFFINTVAHKQGIKILSNAIEKQPDWIVIDEIGRLELAGKGWAKCLEKVITQTNSKVLLAVRDEFVNEVASEFKFQYQLLNKADS